MRARPAAAVLLVAVASGLYTIDPQQCAAKLKSDITETCFEDGLGPGIGYRGQTCIECVMQIPSVATWGCTLSELREFCNLAFEEAPSDLEEEQKHNSSTFVPVADFNKAHASEIKEMRGKLSKAISVFANLLEAFDKKHPQYGSEEVEIMDDIENKKMNASAAIYATMKDAAKKKKSLKRYDQMFMASMRADRMWESQLTDIVEESEKTYAPTNQPTPAPPASKQQGASATATAKAAGKASASAATAKAKGTPAIGKVMLMSSPAHHKKSG